MRVSQLVPCALCLAILCIISSICILTADFNAVNNLLSARNTSEWTMTASHVSVE